MTTTTARALLALVLVAGGLATAMALRPDWLTESVARPTTQKYPAMMIPPNEKCKVLTHRINMKSAIAWQVSEGEMSLIDAAALFAKLSSDTRFPDKTFEDYPGKSLEEKFCRHVISWVVSELTDGPRQAEIPQLLMRLEAELKTHMTQHGRVRFPEM